MIGTGKSRGRIVLGYAVTIALASIIAILTLAPLPAGGPQVSDKLAHILAFATLAFPLSFLRRRMVLGVILGVVAYGAAIEVIQPFWGRNAEWADLLADAIGAILGGAMGYALSSPRLGLLDGGDG